MLLNVCVSLPVLAAVAILAFGQGRYARWLALGFGAAEVLAIAEAVRQIHRLGSVESGRYLRADGLSAFFLVNIALIFALALVYSLDYLRHVGEHRFSSPRWYYALLFFFLFTLVGVCVSANLGLLWIMMEATTLASALLVGFYNTEGAIEAGWKYLIVCTVGIAFALFGTIVLYLAAVKAGMTAEAGLDWLQLMQSAPRLALEPKLLKLAFVFVAVGYGTKIGFVPMHSWLPDAHAEAPSPISAMLSAVLLNCALYGLIRYEAIISKAIGLDFTRGLLLVFGALSVVVAGLLIIVQRDLKRLLAYSSVEHLGIVGIGFGLGGALGVYGALLHAFNHSIGKALMFFVAGNIREHFGTLRMDRIRGVARYAPKTGAALLLGTVAIVGLPPFGLFVSEVAVLSEAFAQAHYLVAALVLLSLSVVFGGMSWQVLRMLFEEAETAPASPRMAFSEALVISFAGCCLLLLGIHVPAQLTGLIRNAMAVL